MFTYLRLLSACFFILLLSACGGGGGSGDDGGEVPTVSSNWGELKWDQDNWN